MAQPAPRTPPSDAYNVLYVEDEDANWETAELALSGRYNLMRVTDAAAAVAVIRERRFDTILMDIQLSASDLNGLQLTQLLRGQLSGALPSYARGFRPIMLPIIFVTAYGARYTKEDLLAAGGDDVIAKPVDFPSLTLSIARLKLRQVTRESQARLQTPR